MEKNKQTNNKKLIMISTIVIILIAAIILIVVAFSNKKESGTITNIDTRIEELFANDYKYYYYMYGDVVTGDGYIVTEDDEVYYAVIDENLVTTEEISALIEETFLTGYHENRYNASGSNEYIMVDGAMYVKKGSGVCSNIVEIDYSSIDYSYDDTEIYVDYDVNGTYIYNEDGIWRLGVNIYYCEN